MVFCFSSESDFGFYPSIVEFINSFHINAGNIKSPSFPNACVGNLVSFQCAKSCRSPTEAFGDDEGVCYSSGSEFNKSFIKEINLNKVSGETSCR